MLEPKWLINAMTFMVYFLFLQPKVATAVATQIYCITRVQWLRLPFSRCMKLPYLLPMSFRMLFPTVILMFFLVFPLFSCRFSLLLCSLLYSWCHSSVSFPIFFLDISSIVLPFFSPTSSPILFLIYCLCPSLCNFLSHVLPHFFQWLNLPSEETCQHSVQSKCDWRIGN